MPKYVCEEPSCRKIIILPRVVRGQPDKDITCIYCGSYMSAHLTPFGRERPPEPLPPVTIDED